MVLAEREESDAEDGEDEAHGDSCVCVVMVDVFSVLIHVKGPFRLASHNQS